MSLVLFSDEDQPLLLKTESPGLLDVADVKEIEHFCHDHPLILKEKQRNMVDGEESPITCYGCVQPISGLYYGCDRCMFFLHKSCAELPREITHFFHPNHPLTLLPNPPIHYSGCICDVCREDCNRFTYHCSECKFDVDANCASVVHIIPQKIDHKSHNHQLIPLQKSAVFLCDACGTKHEGASYLCTTCGFWINQICASSPVTVKLLIHHHPLTLVYSINCEPKSFICAICDKGLYRSNWIYRCSDCDYYVHINCAAIEIENSRATEIETEQHDLQCNSINIESDVSGVTTLTTELSDLTIFPQCLLLPVPDESVDLYTQFMKEIRIPEKYKDAIEIKHGGHPHHSLIFVDEEMQLGSPSGSDKYCNGCRKSVRTPFYRCRECDFFLHEWCAELPNKLIHPCHPQHPLFMMVPSPFLVCDCCLLLLVDTCMYGCDDCKFFLDMKCASLPRVIRHEAHKHDLALQITSSGSCIGCNAPSVIAFQCDACKINICTRCALLSRTVRHRYDEHTFTLTYSAPPEDDYCEICFEDTESNQWFYHCGKCVQSLHTKCILPFYKYSNITDMEIVLSVKALLRIRKKRKKTKNSSVR